MGHGSGTMAYDRDDKFAEARRVIQERMGDSGGKIVGFALAGLVVLLGLVTSIYTVPTDSVGVVLRFGKPLPDKVDPGLRMKLPFWIDEVAIVPVERQLKQEFGFGTAGATSEAQYTSPKEQEDEKAMVSGDLNGVLVEWVVQYRIRDPRAYLFNVRDPDRTLRNASESVMREVVGDRTVDEVITIGRQEIEMEANKRLQVLVDKYEMGLGIGQVQLKDVNPPKEVRSSFNEVNQAQQERERAINVAKGDYNKAVPQAAGTADQKIQEAEGYATQRVNESLGNVANFEAVFAEYLKAPEVTRQRIYLETMGRTLPALGGKTIIDGDAKNVLPLLNLGAGAKLN